MAKTARDVLQAAVDIAGGPAQLATYLSVEEGAVRADLDGADTLPMDAMLALIDLVITQPGAADGLFADHHQATTLRS